MSVTVPVDDIGRRFDPVVEFGGEFKSVLVELVVFDQHINACLPILDFVHDRGIVSHRLEGKLLDGRLGFFEIVNGTVVQDLQSVLAYASDLPQVETEFRPDAHVYGSTGCETPNHLVHGQVDGYGLRVICPRHLVTLLQREMDQ